MTVVVITPPAAAPVSLDLAKAQCRVTWSDDNLLIQHLVDVATGWIDGPDGWLGRCLMPQTLELREPSFYAQDWAVGGGFIWEQGCWSNWGRWPFESRIRLPYPPFIALTSIIYEDDTGGDQTLTSAGWHVDGEGDLEPSWDAPWPSGRVDADAVRIRYQAGYPTLNGGSSVPKPICQAILMLVSHLYRNPDAVVGVENRDSSTEMPLGFSRLLEPFRKFD